MSDDLANAVVRALRAMEGFAPEPFLDEVNHRLSKTGRTVTEDDLVEILTSDDPTDPARLAFHIQLTRWDIAVHEAWTDDSDGIPTQPGTQPRRELVLSCLGLGTESAKRIDECYPLDVTGTVILSDTRKDWEPWYTDERASERSFYWNAYRGVLERKMDSTAVGQLDRTTQEILRRLADPTRPEPYQSKGLVVGHVQSGKTANFTGVIAKAIDVGYRLVIVLTGTIEILRSQTQRRIDMELVGEENILGGIDPTDSDLLVDVDYAGNGDRDWVEGRFVRHGVRPKDVGVPEIRRLSSSQWDYKKLQAGLSALDFRSGNELTDPRRHLYEPTNLYRSDVRIAVVKKNKTVLQRLVADLRSIHTRLGEIPVLIIDDEADQASVNTVNPNKSSPEQRERSAINKLIAEVLGLLGRAQYIGYTATPFANVFVDPDDSENIFPKDFIVSLEPPAAYMGGRDFHDLDLAEDDERAFATSNEKAFVRSLRAGPNDDAARDKEIQQALDAYVLAGAVKLYREQAMSSPGRFRHHTMLVHESVRMAEHKELAGRVLAVWRRAGYSTPHGMRRLHDLWKADFLPVSEARGDGMPVPTDFQTLREHIGTAVDRISRGRSPIVVVNGGKDADYEQDDLDFQRGDVWKILVGGTKLSRGFTVEGLTVSYYTRRTTAADTLMQMGRWFGFRAGYKDLVRLYIGRNVPGPRNSYVDLYKTFEAIVRDEEDFREELRSFQGLDEEGRPKVRPIDVPPMVFQSLPWLKPTQSTKMYNAELTFTGEGGKVRDFFQQPPRSEDVNRSHFEKVTPLLDAADQVATFFDDQGNTYRARYGVVDAAVMKQAIHEFSWTANYSFQPTLTFMDDVVARGLLTEWVVLAPELAGASVAPRTVSGRPDTLHVLKRTRRDDRGGVFSGSSPRQRRAMEIISGGVDAAAPGADRTLVKATAAHPTASRLHTPTRGAFLLTFAADTGRYLDPTQLKDPVDPSDIATLFSLAFPKASAPVGRIGFKVKVPNAGAIVDRQ
jgi:hypothetical protein